MGQEISKQRNRTTGASARTYKLKEPKKKIHRKLLEEQGKWLLSSWIRKSGALHDLTETLEDADTTVCLAKVLKAVPQHGIGQNKSGEIRVD